MKNIRTKFALIAVFALMAGAGQSFAAWDGKSIEKPQSQKIDGKVFYLIGNEANLAWFTDSVYRAGGTSTLNAKLTKSLDMGGKLFMPISAGMGRNQFAGIIDGDGFTISNLYIDAGKIAEIKNPFCDASVANCNAQNAAFIAVMSGGAVKNLNFDNLYITASASAGEILGAQQPVSVGGVVAWQKGGTIEGCSVSGKILTSGNGNGVGGIVGNAWNGTIKNNLSSVSIYASGNQTYIGGIAGFIRGKNENDKVAVESCAYDGAALVNSGDGKQGGIVGNFEYGVLNVGAAYFDKDVASEGVGKKTDSLEVDGETLSEEELNVDKVTCALNGGELKDGACDKDGVWSVGETHIVVNGVSRNESGALMFEVKFDANGGVFRDGDKTSKLLKVGDKITATEIIPPTRGDTVFAGWALAKDAETPDEDLGAADRAKTVYAVWKKMFTVKFDANGGTFPDESTEKSKVVADGAAIDVSGFDVPQTYTSEEEVKYYFSGWALEADAEAALETLGSATDNVTLYAVWTEAPTFTVTYDTRGFGVTVDYVQEGETTTLPETPKADGYKFVGWFTDSTFAEGSEFDSETPIAENVVAYAKWDIVEYEIVYIMGKGANNEANPVSYTVETPTIKLQPPTKKGYHFDGWYYDADFVNTATQITEGSTGKVKLYAKWEIKTFTVTYMAGEFALEIVEPDVKAYGDTIKLKEASFTRYGYLQDGWSTKDGGKKKYDLGAEYAADADVALFPHWVKDPTAIPVVAKAAARFGVVANGRTLELSGVRSGTPVAVFDIRGHVVAKATASASSFSMGTFVPGMYLVRVGNDVQRVLVR
ncbi:InlB B-repeat-containing protein [uncultured Fibrobacter sp.]|uniref:InlB B-repeat-containing protein n=1 Tax=uncultured Fibrobacter sp. TaxID=261512 RepID=UPI0025FA4C67|nr:InlB B-repeat-containing protein [uncultured Fibrobacter sp.]